MSKKGEKAFNHRPCEIKKRNLGPDYNPTKPRRNLVWGKHTQTDYDAESHWIANRIDALCCIILFLQTEESILLSSTTVRSILGEERSELPREAKMEGECEDLDWKWS